MAFPTKLIVYKKNSQVIEIDNLADLVGNYQNAAVVTGTLYDPSGVACVGFTNISFGYVAASNGIYKAQIDQTFDPAVIGGGYILKVDASQAGLTAHWEIKVTVAIRNT